MVSHLRDGVDKATLEVQVNSRGSIEHPPRENGVSMRKKDLLWVLAYPLYQLIGTFRHEGSHALVVLASGGEVTEFSFLPTPGYWGYIRFEGQPPPVLMDAAPYLVDALTFSVFFAICMLVVFKWRWLWINLIAIGMVSPLVNSAYNYVVGWDSMNDVGDLLAAVPPPRVHAYFLLTLGAYLIGLILVFTVSRMVRARQAAAAGISEGAK